MCEIQLLKKYHSNLDDEDVKYFDKLMSFGSFMNHDAFGIFNRNNYIKCCGKYDASKFDNTFLKEDNFVVGHNRLSTSMSIIPNILYNDEELNMQNHPFIIGDFGLIHNGVIRNNGKLRKKYNVKSDIKTDSYIILYLINKFFHSSKGNRIERIAHAINKTTQQISGSYSCFLYDGKLDTLYYFKNFRTDFYFRLYDKSVLCGSTTYENLDYIYFGKKYKVIDIEDDRIYLLTNNPKNPLMMLGECQEIAEKKKVYPQDKNIHEKTIIHWSFPWNMFVGMANWFLLDDNQKMKGGVDK